MNLKDRTAVIIHRVKSIKLNYWDLGSDLLYIYQNKLYKQEHSSMEEYVENHKEDFGFGYRQAQKYIVIAQELKRDEVSSSIPIEKLQLLARIPEESRDEIIKLVEEEDKSVDTKDLSREIKRFKGQVGTKPAYPDQAEQEYKLIREGELILQIRRINKNSIFPYL